MEVADCGLRIAGCGLGVGCRISDVRFALRADAAPAAARTIFTEGNPFPVAAQYQDIFKNQLYLFKVSTEVRFQHRY